MTEETYPKFRYGYRDARDKNGFPIYKTKNVRTKKGKIVEIKEPVKVWGKILMPTFYFHCRFCDKKLTVGSKQGLLVAEGLFCIDCFASGKHKEMNQT